MSNKAGATNLPGLRKSIEKCANGTRKRINSATEPTASPTLPNLRSGKKKKEQAEALFAKKRPRTQDDAGDQQEEIDLTLEPAAKKMASVQKSSDDGVVSLIMQVKKEP